MGKRVFWEIKTSKRIAATVLVLLMAASILTSMADHQWEEAITFSRSSSMDTNAHIHVKPKQAPSTNSSDGESPAQNTFSIEYMLLGIWGVIATGLIAYDTRRCKNPKWMWWIIGTVFAYPIVPFIYLWTRREAAKSFIKSLSRRGKKKTPS